jgi:hypothetical protein
MLWPDCPKNLQPRHGQLVLELSDVGPICGVWSRHGYTFRGSIQGPARLSTNLEEAASEDRVPR